MEFLNRNKNKILVGIVIVIILIGEYLLVQPKYTQPKNVSEFVDAYRARYPIPSPQPIPKGLEDELFLAFSSDPRIKKTFFVPPGRELFILEEYYADVTNGWIGDREGTGAHWTMNKINGVWTVTYLESGEYPRCETIKSYLKDLKDWQGLCYSDKLKLIDAKHPDETYNNY